MVAQREQMFMKQWEEKTTVSSISFQCTLFEIMKKYSCPLKIADTSFNFISKFTFAKFSLSKSILTSSFHNYERTLAFKNTL